MGLKAVVLAAGKGARLSPLTTVIPKELLPINGLPAIHHVVRELTLLGVRDIMLVLSEGKESVAAYFTRSASPKGGTAERLESSRRDLISRVDISVAYQRELNGTAGAVLLARDFAAGDDLIVAYPDDVLYAEGEPTGDLSTFAIDSPRRSHDCVLLVRDISGRDARSYGVVMPQGRITDGAFRVSRIVEKPITYTRPRAYALVGRMRLTSECLAELDRHEMTDREGIIPALNAMAARGKLSAEIAKRRVSDIGSHEGYLEAVDRYDTLTRK